MAEPWIRYQPQNEGNLYQPEKTELPYSKGLEPLAGVMATVDYLTTNPIRGGLSQAQKTGPWDFFKGAYNALRHPNTSPTATEVAKQSGLSDKPLNEKTGRLSFGGMASKLSPAQVGGFIGENVLDPSNLVPVGKAMALGGLAMGGLKKVGKEVGILKKLDDIFPEKIDFFGNGTHVEYKNPETGDIIIEIKQPSGSLLSGSDFSVSNEKGKQVGKVVKGKVIRDFNNQEDALKALKLKPSTVNYKNIPNEFVI